MHSVSRTSNVDQGPAAYKSHSIHPTTRTPFRTYLSPHLFRWIRKMTFHLLPDLSSPLSISVVPPSVSFFPPRFILPVPGRLSGYRVVKASDDPFAFVLRICNQDRGCPIHEFLNDVKRSHFFSSFFPEWTIATRYFQPFVSRLPVNHGPMRLPFIPVILPT